MSRALHVMMHMVNNQKEQLARTIQSLQQDIEALQQDLQDHDQKWLTEMEMIRAISGTGLNFQGFYRSFQTRQALLETRKARLEQDREEARKRLQQCFEQEARYAQVLEQHQRAQAHKEAAIRQNTLDEWGARKQRP